jgi:PAS domain S-box-containing protein
MTDAVQNLEAIIRSATDAIVTVDRDGLIAAWNPAAARLFGHAEAEAVGQPVTLIVPARFREAHLAGLRRVLETGETRIIGQTVEVFGLRQDGSEFPIELALSTWEDGGAPDGDPSEGDTRGRARFFTAIVRDISERVRLVEALRESESRVEAILESANDGIVSVDHEGIVVLWNQHAERLFARTRAEMVGEPLTAIIPERFRALHEAGLARVARGGEQHVIGHTVELAALRRDGSEFPIELSLAMVARENEAPFFTAIIRDITERVRLVEGLRDSEARFGAIVQSANDAIVSIDGVGAVVLWNPRAEAMFGWTADEMAGQPLERIIPEQYRDLHRAGIARVAGGGETHVIGETVELSALHRDGREFPIELSLARWDSKDGVRFSGIVRDISARKRAEGDLQQASAALAEKNEQLEGLSAKLAKYLSRQVYDSIFSGRNEVRVESYRKKLTVFFSDIQGFTELTDRMEAEPLSEVLNHYLSEMSAIAAEFGGTVDKFIGDGIMIFFGDPETRGDREDAIACARMALAMRERIEALKDEWQRVAGSVELHVRMGINTGYCTVGNFGSEDRLDYTIVGREVNLASRLEQAAAPDQILVSHDTRELIKDVIDCHRVGEIKVKGLAYPVRTYEATGMAEDHRGTPTTAAAERLLSQFDPSKLAPEEAEAARAALRQVLGALDGQADATAHETADEATP